jgi:hypothetical protein
VDTAQITQAESCTQNKGTAAGNAKELNQLLMLISPIFCFFEARKFAFTEVGATDALQLLCAAASTKAVCAQRKYYYGNSIRHQSPRLLFEDQDR